MGKENVAATESCLRIQIESPAILPVPVPAVDSVKAVPSFPKTLKCAWVGRLCDFKYRILEHLIERLALAAGSVGPVELCIVGDGPYRNHIENAAVAHRGRNFSVEFKGELSPEELKAHLLDQVDVLFAMGTSALEGARLGVPVFLANFSYEKISRLYRFRFLFDDEGSLSLGEEITAGHCEDRSSLESSLSAVVADYGQYSRLSRAYWARHFSMESARTNLLRHVDATRATFGEMADMGYSKPDFFGYAIRSLSLALRKELPRGSGALLFDR
jgi:glycosyltransferase involved in cell wall biosynthesis